ncbi:hypothetical protein JCM19239_4809 [Vibrio variabilis]|uniref:Uncharacterized protein n=1 Tax=Vibrio variabilis TaxID=990271 RepID=A0ABQ0JGH1_9VIBR|nr:hypothetical protein JCM19239_4809 [Vibrio variabilis]
MGYFYTSTGTWSTSLVFIAIVALFCALFANLAARDQKVLERQHS